MFVLPFLLFSFTLTYGDQIVQYAAVIYRHGDRTPVDPYPTDPWRNESLWPVKFGELTNIGKRQHYALGKWLRKRYLVGLECIRFIYIFSSTKKHYRSFFNIFFR